jgi:hypothetical protein
MSWLAERPKPIPYPIGFDTDMAAYAAQTEVMEQTLAKELAGIFHRQTSLLRGVCDSQAGRIR